MHVGGFGERPQVGCGRWPVVALQGERHGFRCDRFQKTLWMVSSRPGVFENSKEILFAGASGTLFSRSAAMAKPSRSHLVDRESIKQLRAFVARHVAAAGLRHSRAPSRWR